MSNITCGYKGHGRIGVYYTPKQSKELRRRENAEMEILLVSQQDAVSEGDKETAELAQESCVSFGSSIQILEAPNSLSD
jgi:hypothetical protein